mmetsp:Transcript_30766/g.79032  ORF Transcript_30766/g.79032 Transcript_30766/m.79032 type:complete len:255 (-) Transcript_30766:428-1192(-)
MLWQTRRPNFVIRFRLLPCAPLPRPPSFASQRGDFKVHRRSLDGVLALHQAELQRAAGGGAALGVVPGGAPVHAGRLRRRQRVGQHALQAAHRLAQREAQVVGVRMQPAQRERRKEVAGAGEVDWQPRHLQRQPLRAAGRLGAGGAGQDGEHARLGRLLQARHHHGGGAQRVQVLASGERRRHAVHQDARQLLRLERVGHQHTRHARQPLAVDGHQFRRQVQLPVVAHHGVAHVDEVRVVGAQLLHHLHDRLQE